MIFSHQNKLIMFVIFVHYSVFLVQNTHNLPTKCNFNKFFKQINQKEIKFYLRSKLMKSYYVFERHNLSIFCTFNVADLIFIWLQADIMLKPGESETKIHLVIIDNQSLLHDILTKLLIFLVFETTINICY